MVRTQVKLLPAALIATFALALCAGGASASRLAFSAGDFRFTWTPMRIGYAEITPRCNVTMAGSFHSTTVAKTANLRVGFITTASVQSENFCEVFTVATETLPWDLRYVSFGESLPRISSVQFKIVNLGMRYEISGVRCFARTKEAEPLLVAMARNTETGVVTGIIAEERPGIRNELPIGCSLFDPFHYGGTGTVTNVRGEALRITLV